MIGALVNPRLTLGSWFSRELKEPNFFFFVLFWGRNIGNLPSTCHQRGISIPNLLGLSMKYKKKAYLSLLPN